MYYSKPRPRIKAIKSSIARKEARDEMLPAFPGLTSGHSEQSVPELDSAQLTLQGADTSERLSSRRGRGSLEIHWTLTTVVLRTLLCLAYATERRVPAPGTLYIIRSLT